MAEAHIFDDACTGLWFPYRQAVGHAAELQGRLPIRVELKALTRDDFVRILTETEARLIKQYKALLATEINTGIENIGARRLQTVMEKLVEEISFSASERSGEAVTITAGDVRTRVGELAKNADLTKFIL